MQMRSINRGPMSIGSVRNKESQEEGYKKTMGLDGREHGSPSIHKDHTKYCWSSYTKCTTRAARAPITRVEGPA